jgi:hypothetical protein
MRLHLSPARAATSDGGSALGGVLIAVIILAAVAIGAFFYFGGKADVKIKKPDVKVSSSETPS